MRRQLLVIPLLLSATVAMAGEADVISADATHAGNGVWRFSVTVKHGDEGWNHYANQFEILTEDGTVLGTRTLHHPHVDEQPFTRNLGGVRIPDGVMTVIVRARDSVHEHGGRELKLKLPQ